MATVSGLCLISLRIAEHVLRKAISTSLLQITAQIRTAKLVWSFNRGQKKKIKLCNILKKSG